MSCQAELFKLLKVDLSGKLETYVKGQVILFKSSFAALQGPRPYGCGFGTRELVVHCRWSCNHRNKGD